MINRLAISSRLLYDEYNLREESNMKNVEEIKDLAKWCLNCKVKPCSKTGCPMQTNIPEFIDKIKTEEYEEAYKILLDNNIFSHICSLVCPQEDQCEGSCIRGIKQTPTKIGQLEQFINEWAIENKIEYKIEKCEKNGKKVAIVGSGPAGIECAIELLKNGYDVTIFEKDKVAGGILWYGIPDFRLPREIVQNIVKKIENMGAIIKTGVELGKDITIESLKKEFDSIFLAIGATTSTTYSLAEKKLESVYESDVFLKAYNENQFLRDLGKVVVIGGGNVAMDTARVAVRMGAESVKILYRRDEEHMPARKIELKEAIEDGVEFVPLTRVISANVEGGKMVSVNCMKTEIVEGKAVDVKDTQFVVEADTVVFAIGLKPEKALLEKEGIVLNDWGMVQVDENGQTNIENVYAGGDVTESKSTVCRALAAGKRAALGMMRK